MTGPRALVAPARRAALLKGLLVVCLLGWPLVGGSAYSLSVMTSAGLFALLTLAVVVILGQAGQLSFGHSAFYGIGAYTTGLLATKLSWPTLACLILGALTAGVVALVVGRAVLRLRYFYLALATIGLGQIFLVMVTQLRGVTGGPNGFALIPPLRILGFSFESSLSKYYLVWGFAILVLLFIARALKHRFGRALRAIATSELASDTLGLRTANWKLLAFVASAVICGLAGGLFAFIINAVTPNAFTFSAAVLPIVMMLVGGVGSAWGAIVGSVLMTWVVYGFTSVQRGYSGVTYSVVMILLLMFLPAGFALRPEQRAKVVAWFRRETAVASLSGPGVSNEASAFEEPDMDGAASVAVGSCEPGCARTISGGQTQPLLCAQGLTVRFGGLRAADDVSLEVREGQIVSLIGPNGAGKTTVFNAVSRLQKLAGGQVMFAGHDVTKMTTADAARLGLARTFQNLRIYSNMSVLENVLVGRHRHERSGLLACGLGLPYQRREERVSRDEAMAVLEFLGLADSAEVPAASLPYGRQRLVEIARALASKPRMLLLDEPAAGMNGRERSQLVEQIARIRDSGVTVLLVEHDVELVTGISDHIYVLDHGKLIFNGSPQEVRTSECVIEAYLGVSTARTHLRVADVSVDAARAEAEEMLRVEGLGVSYGSVRAVDGVSFGVRRGEITTILGANGAGKSTLLHTISGLLHPSEGSIVYQGREISGLSPNKITARGVCQVMERRRLFPTLSVRDNLVVGASALRGSRSSIDADVRRVYELFPILGERRGQAAGTLSGGEQQMLAIGRALMGRPDLLLLDEPSMGLAPMIVERIFETLSQLNRDGLTLLMVEQNAELALDIAHHGLVLQNGRVVLSGTSDVLRLSQRVRDGYLGKSPASTRK
jgi:branched-chain amino acid transport system ATP-binding protein